jgi:predicted MPP superfamily phosphohydrolase
MEGFKIVFLSDFHLYPHTQLEHVIEAVQVANSCKPDLVALGGDYVLSTAEAIFDLAPALAKLNARVGVFSILGNHDHWQGDKTVVQGLTQSGIPVLRNTGMTIDIGRGQFYLAGTDDGWVRRNDLKAALEKRPEGLFTLLLMHEPDFADEASSDGRVSIQISGHSHGGQVRLPFYGSPFLPPYGRKYDMGLYKVGDMQLYTNVGIGVTAPIRLNCPPEVTEITLTRA